ncbi:Elongation factor 2, partial [Parelaphostrongylus tenuis]
MTKWITHKRSSPVTQAITHPERTCLQFQYRNLEEKFGNGKRSGGVQPHGTLTRYGRLLENELFGGCHGRKGENICQQYEVSRESYQMVIAHLKNKYDQLLNRLHTTEARSERLEDQETLCESLCSIINQLRYKGEPVDSMYLQQQLLRKFSRKVQRYTLDRTHQLETEQKQEAEGCTTEELLSIISQYISKELTIETQMGKPRNFRRDLHIEEDYSDQRTRISSGTQGTTPCIYCKRTSHRSVDCDELRTNEERVKHIRAHNLCINCGAPGHSVAKCKSGPCRNCGKQGHHTSICKDRIVPLDNSLRDAQGEYHDIKVTIVENITNPLRRVPLIKQDRFFLRDNNIKLSIDPHTQSIKPKILLGCADLFSLLDNGLAPKKILPSGLLLISSKLGYLITGAHERDQPPSNGSTLLFTETTNPDDDCEEQSWNEFCTFESTGIHEFTGPTAKERELQNMAIWRQFEETIEKTRRWLL